MDDYIKREEVYDQLDRWARDLNYPKMYQRDDARCVIDGIPSADVAPVRHGRWIELAMKGEFKCSVCGRGSKSENTFQLIPTVYWNYCPNCGAKMDGEND